MKSNGFVDPIAQSAAAGAARLRRSAPRRGRGLDRRRHRSSRVRRLASGLLLARSHGRSAGRAHAPAHSFPARFLRLLLDGEYFAVHSHVLLFGGVIAALSAAVGVPFRVVHAHNGHDGRSDRPARQAYRAAMRRLLQAFASRTLAVSGSAEAFLGTESEILPCGIGLEPFSRPPDPALRQALGLRPGAFVIGHVGRLAPAKNQALLLDAFAQARHSGADLQLVIIGDGPLHDTLADRARALAVSEEVRLLGARNDVPRLMLSVFDAFAMPSLHEGLPLAALEAQAAGLPCLLSDRISRETDAAPQVIERLSLDAGPRT